MKINFVTPGPTARTGHAISALLLRDALEKEGYDVDVTERMKKGVINHGHFTDLISPSSYYGSRKAVLNPFHKSKYEIITSYGPAAPNLNDIGKQWKYAAKNGLKRKTAFLFMFHHLPKFMKPNFKDTIQISSCEYLKKKIEYNSRISDISVIKVPFPTKTKKYTKAKEDLIVFIGKGQGMRGDIALIKAIPEILKENPNMKFVIANKEMHKKKVYYDNLVDKLGIKNNVKLYGKITYEKTHDFLERAKLIALPYTCAYGSTSVPISVLEAMSFAKPVISSNIGTMPEIIKDGKNGILAEADNVHSIASHVNRWINDEKALKKFGENALETIKKEHSPRKIAKQYSKIYNSL
jgi:glycosyltransferase involved in cell wall biosynthesis